MSGNGYNGMPALSPQDSSAQKSLGPVGSQQVILIFSEENVSMEELRADLEKYRYDEEKIKEQVSKLDSSIESRLSSLKNFSQ